MATDLARLVVTLEAQNAKYLKQLDASQRKLTRFEQSTSRSLRGIEQRFKRAEANLSRSARAIGGALISAATINKIVSATKAQEAAVKQLEQGLSTTGNVVGRSLGELTAKAAELQKATTFGDEDIIAAQAKLVTFTSITKEQFDRTIEAALDLSTRMDQDLKSSVVQLGKALNDPIANLSALSRTGIQFSEAQKETIENLAETNRLAEAQDVILKELERQFGGSAKAARDTFGGALDGLGNAFGDLFEAQDGLEDARVEVEKLTKILQDPNTIEGINNLTSGIVGAVGKLIDWTAKGANALKLFGEDLAASVTGGGAGVESAIRDIERIFEAARGLSGLNEKRLAKDVGLIQSLIGMSSEAQLKSYMAQVDAAIKETAGLLDAGVGGTGQVRKNLERQYQVLLDINGALDDASKKFANTPKVNTGGPDTGDAGGNLLPPVDPSLIKKFEALKENLQQQVALYGETGQAAKLRYEIEHSELAKLSQEQKSALVGLADALDSKALLSQFDTLKASLEQQVALYGETGQAAKLRYELEHGELAKLAESQKSVLLGLAGQLDEQATREENDKIISLQQEKFDRMREQALAALGQDYEVEAMRHAQQLEGLQTELARLEERGLATQEIRDQFHQAELDAEAIHQAKITEIQEAEAEKRRRILETQLDAVGSFFGMIGQLAKDGSKASRIALAAEKAAAVAKAIINMQVAISQASTLPFPANVPAIAQAASQGAQIVASIKSVDVAAVAHGGLNLDDIGMRADEMTILAQRGERILSRDQNRDLTDFINSRGNDIQPERAAATGGGDQSPPNIGVFIDPQSMTDFMATSKGRQNIVESIRLEADTIKAILG